MRTTLDIDEDVLMAAKELARRQHKTAGQVISQLARRAMTRTSDPGVRESGDVQTADSTRALYGFRPFPSRGKVVTNQTVDRLRDEEGI